MINHSLDLNAIVDDKSKFIVNFGIFNKSDQNELELLYVDSFDGYNELKGLNGNNFKSIIGYSEDQFKDTSLVNC